MSDKVASVGIRLGSMFLDHIVMCFLLLPPVMIISFVFGSDEPFETSTIELLSFYMIVLVYLNKDFFSAKSVAKRLLGLQVIDRKTSVPANELKCFLRNMTIPIWPVEVFISLFSPTRRLGD